MKATSPTSTEAPGLTAAGVSPQDAESPVVLTLDVGSSSTRAMLFDAHGRAISGLEARVEHTLSTPSPGAAEDDGEQAVERVGQVIDAVLKQAGELAHQIGGVGMDTYVPNLLGIGADGQPVTPVYTYADTRDAADVAVLRRDMDERAAHQRTGTHLHTSYMPARLLWLKKQTQHKKVARWAFLSDYIISRFFDKPAARQAGISVASWSGLLNRQTLQWDEEWLRYLSLPIEMLPGLVDGSEQFCGLSQTYAARWPVLRDIPWFPAVGDGAAANVGSGCVTADRVALTVGTTAAMRVVLSTALAEVPWGLWLYRVDRQRSLLGGATTEGGNVFAWMTQTLRLGRADSPQADRAEVERLLASMSPDGHGLTILPFWGGERSPGWAGDARAVIAGMGLDTRPIDILRAGLESVAYRFGLIDELLGQVIPADRRIIASGGALFRSPAWVQIMADVLGRPIYTSPEEEATSRGVALLVLEALGKDKPLSNVASAQLGEAAQPNLNNHHIYQRAVKRQADLYRRIMMAST